jgi:hypothetical protein
MGVVKSHAAKAEAANQLARKHKLPDISDLLPDLNTSRKAHAYGDIEAPDLDAEEFRRSWKSSRMPSPSC